MNECDGASALRAADLLCAHRRARAAQSEARAEMVKFIVAEIGIPHEEALRMKVEEFLDGYLVARGVAQSWRREEST